MSIAWEFVSMGNICSAIAVCFWESGRNLPTPANNEDQCGRGRPDMMWKGYCGARGPLEYAFR